MKIKTVYNPDVLKTFKIFDFVVALTLIITDIVMVLEKSWFCVINDSLLISVFVVNIICLILVSLPFFYNAKIILRSLIAFTYSFFILATEPQNHITVFLYYFAVVNILNFDFFRKHKKVVVFISTIIYIFSMTIELRFGLPEFFKSILYKTGYAVFFFIPSYLTIFGNYKTAVKKLDLAQFPGMKKQDAEWLSELLNGEKYQSIATSYKHSLSSVKNRFKEIYKIINVLDKRDFLTKYNNFEICFGNEFSSKSLVTEKPDF